ncbi:MAG: DUF3298 and DUF4163 domain-containing protein [Anaerolineae bacterium]
MRRLMIAAALFVLCVAVSGVSARQDDQCLQKGGNLQDDGTCKLSAQINISVDYPLDLAQNPLIADAVDPFIAQTKNDLLQFLMEGFNPGPAQYELDVTYATSQRGDNLLSLIFTEYVYTGGAHPTTVFKTFTFDLHADRVLMLDDLFKPGIDPYPTLGATVEDLLRQQLAGISDDDFIHSGAGENPDNYQNFALDGSDLVFYFPPAQVAAHAAGPQILRVPLSALSSILAPEYLS